MHDIKAIRDDPEAYVRGWASRRVAEPEGVVGELLKLDAELRAAQTAMQVAQARRNEASKLIGQAKANKDEDQASRLMAEVEGLKAAMAAYFTAEGKTGGALKEKLAALPNLPADGVPEGADEDGNIEIPNRRFGDPASLPAGRLNAPKDHVELGEALGLMDFEAAVRMSGSRFVVLKGELARLERALGQFMLDIQTTEHGFTEVSPPLLVKDDAVFGTGQLPKFEEDLFKTERIEGYRDLILLSKSIARTVKNRSGQIDSIFNEPAEARQSLLWQWIGDGSSFLPTNSREAFDTRLQEWLLEDEELGKRLFLIPTAEVSLTNLVREQITAEDELPLRLTALTPCFRSEAGASGQDTRGMIRQHQFYKVELVAITTPEQSADELERMTDCASAVLKRLGLPFRTMLLCTGDMGFSARRTYDIEVWLPSQNRYREISSVSNCGDFQARRMDARCQVRGGKGTRFVHTMNGSGLAVGRTLVAVLENYQDENGRIAIPDALVPYMGGLTHIGGKG